MLLSGWLHRPHRPEHERDSEFVCVSLPSSSSLFFSHFLSSPGKGIVKSLFPVYITGSISIDMEAFFTSPLRAQSPVRDEPLDFKKKDEISDGRKKEVSFQTQPSSPVLDSRKKDTNILARSLAMLGDLEKSKSDLKDGKEKEKEKEKGEESEFNFNDGQKLTPILESKMLNLGQRPEGR